MKTPAKRNDSKNVKRLNTLAEQTRKQKDALLEELVKCPIIQVACERTGVGRATYYKWRENDEEFRTISSKAINEGRKFINDIAESQLIKKIKEGNTTSIIYWLKNNNKRYSEKFSDELDQALPILPPDQREELRRAMKLTGLSTLMKFHDEKTKKFIESMDEIKETDEKESSPKIKDETIAQTAPKPSERRTGVNLKEFFKKNGS